MAEEPHVIRGINWRETFPFTNIFRAFRVAVHPSKLALGLVALLLLYFGGRMLDMVWLMSPTSRVVDSTAEIRAFHDCMSNPQLGSFSDWKKNTRDGLVNQYAAALQATKVVEDADKAKSEAKDAKRLSDFKKKCVELRDDDVKKSVKARDEALKDAKGDKDKEKKAWDDYYKAVQANYKGASAAVRSAERVQGDGVFITFFNFEAAQVNGVARGVLANNWLDVGGVKDCILNFIVWGPAWAFGAHWLFAIIFGLWLLIIWAVFGGAIARISAVQVAREEKISVRQAIGFSINKFLSFLSAPLIPLVIVFVAGSVVALVGMGLMYVTPLLGILMILALIAGFVMTLLLIGTFGGLNLMYPTVAVEGSDSFDAISRSFSYVFAKPWRMLWYTLVAVVYGALTYVFVRFVVYLSLILTHFFVGWWSVRSADSEYLLWSEMWPKPDFWSMPYQIDFMSLSTLSCISAVIIAFWVYIIIALMGAFVISFYFSANTIIYYLMRKEVDATEMDDVYVEQKDEEVTEPAAAPAAPAAEAAATPGATVAPASPVIETPAAPATPPAAEPPANPPTT